MITKIKNIQLAAKQTAASLLCASMAVGLSWPAMAEDNTNTDALKPYYNTAQKTNRIIVKYRRSDNDLISIAEAMDRTEITNDYAGASLTFSHQMSNNADVLALDHTMPIEDVEAIAKRISENPNVLYAEPDYIMYPQSIPDDEFFDKQWHFFEQAGGINLPDALDISTGEGVVVAVIDSGILPHVDLQDRVLPGYDFVSDADNARDGDGRDGDPTDEGDWRQPNFCGQGDPGQAKSSWHGTHVSGTIAASTNNGIGVAGVAGSAKLLPLRVIGVCGGFVSDIAEAMRWAAGLQVENVPNNPNPAKVLNLSLGGKGECPNTYSETIAAVRETGATIIVAAGNSDDDASLYNPANCPGVVTVGANNRAGGRAYYSNYGSTVDIAAPGGETVDPIKQIRTWENGIGSTGNTGGTVAAEDAYVYKQGTSMAAPHVSGVAALLYSINPNLTPDEVETILKDSARSFPAVTDRPCDTTLCGTGILDAYAAVNAVDVTPSPSNQLEEKNLSADTNQMLYFELTVPKDAKNLTFSLSGGTGDADLFVKFGSKPTSKDYDAKSEAAGNEESISIKSIQAGTYYIGVYAYEAFSGVTLKGHYKGGSKPPVGNKLTNDVPVSDLSAAVNQFIYYEFDVPEGAKNLTITLSGGKGDADLFVKFGSQPSRKDFDDKSEDVGNDDSITFKNVQAGTYHIGVYAYEAFSGLTLKGHYSDGNTTPPTVVELQNGVPVTGMTATSGQALLFKLNVPEKATQLAFAIAGGTGNADLFVKYGAIPTTSDYDFSSTGKGNKEALAVRPVQAGTYYVMVYGQQNFDKVALIGQYKTETTTPGNTYRNDTDTPIADGDKNRPGISTINIDRSGNAGLFELSVSLVHDAVGDLDVFIIAPQGQYLQLKSKDSNDTRQAITLTGTINASTIPVTGPWKIVAFDTEANGKSGYIDSWSMTFK